MNRSTILAAAAVAVFHTALVFSLYLLFAGHNQPGGGFAGGLVAAAALVIRYVDGGAEAVRALVPLEPMSLLGAGLVLANLTGVAAWLAGGAFLESATWSWDLPVLGTVKTSSALAFDTGVYLVVVALVLMVLRTLGEEDAA
ncbi:MAG: MnhB domain-containing protein [Acidimicrobiales bacterium]